MTANAILRYLAAFVGVVIGGGMGTWVVLWVSMRSTTVRVPSLVGLSSLEAITELQSAGLSGQLEDGVFSSQIFAGRIAEQRPEPGLQLKRGNRVRLFPSLGSASQKVPDLTGLPISMAEAELESEGLRAGRRCLVDGQANALVVLAQAPQPRALVPPGSEIALLINRTPRRARYVMPDFVGVGEADASRVVRALGFRVASVQRVPYPGVPGGTVLRQDPPAGGPVPEASVVGLWVSR
jgi:serine/threonine-protein kinase